MEEASKTPQELTEELERLRGRVAELERSLAQADESEQKFRALAEKSMVGIYLLQDGMFKYVNARFAEIHGYTIDELLHIGANQTVFPEDLHIVLENLRRRQAGEVKSLHYEFRIITKAGEVRNVEVFGSSTLYRGRPAVIGSLLDITDRKQTEEKINNLNRVLQERVAELNAANEELRMVNYSISHDLKTPLITIEAFSRKILDKYASQLEPKCLEYVEWIHRSSFRMERLIQELLSFFKSGHKPIEAVPIDTEGLVREVLDEQEALHPDRRIHLHLGPLPAIHGDQTMIRQVWVNLLSNAVKFSLTREITIDVTCRTEEGRHIFYVRDYGVGFPSDQASRLFQAFSRLHPDSSFEGTGIGLAIVKRTIQRHGGEVWAESVEGEGATFYFSLPTEDCQLHVSEASG
ncbi:MAG: PAS domain S-box protein [Deltaproteobacteria bacterium]|nr:PAS domain S-box protein [Deltaproteobacteria bacterium]